jgi:hypothetical protein
MPDIAAIGAILNGVKTAIDIAKAIKDADVSLEKAEMKLQVAELISALADAKIGAAEILALIEAKDAEISELQESLKIKETFIRFHDAYYVEGKNKEPSGDPYCSHCWEVDNKPVHLHRHTAREKMCPRCRTIYESRRAPENMPREGV